MAYNSFGEFLGHMNIGVHGCRKTMVIDAAISGAIVTAACGLIAAVIAKLRCRFLVNNQTEGCLEWSLACGFTEVKLPMPRGNALVEEGILYVKKTE